MTRFPPTSLQQQSSGLIIRSIHPHLIVIAIGTRLTSNGMQCKPGYLPVTTAINSSPLFSRAWIVRMGRISRPRNTRAALTALDIRDQRMGISLLSPEPSIEPRIALYRLPNTVRTVALNQPENGSLVSSLRTSKPHSLARAESVFGE